MYKIDYNQNKENCFLYRAILFVGLSTCYLFSMEKSSIISRVDISLPHNTTIYCNILAMLDEFVKNTKNMLYNLKHVNQYATHGRVPNVLVHNEKQFFMADGRKEKLPFRYMALDYIIASPNDDISLKNANKKAWYQYNSHRIDQNNKMFCDLLLYRQDGSIIHRDDKALCDNKKLKAVIGLKLILPNTFCNFHKFSQYIKYINQEYVSPELMKHFFELNKDWSVDEAEKIIEDPYMKLLYYFSNLIAFKHVVPLYVLFIVDPYIEVDVATMYKRPMLIPAHDNLPESYYGILCQPEQHYLIDIYLDPKCMKQKSKEKKIPQKQVYSVLSEFLKQYPFIHKMDILHNALFQLSMTMFIERVIPDNLNSIIRFCERKLS